MKLFQKSEEVYISLICSDNLYVDIGDTITTINNRVGTKIKNIKNNEEYYCVKFNRSAGINLEMWKSIILKPTHCSVFWPVDIICREDEYGVTYFFVFTYRFVPKTVSLNTLSKENKGLGFEKNIIKNTIDVLLNTIRQNFDYQYLYMCWDDSMIFIDEENGEILIPFSFYMLYKFNLKISLNTSEYFSVCLDPYAYLNRDCDENDFNSGVYTVDFYSEMYAIASLLFKLLIGRYPFEGALMDGIFNSTDDEKKRWISEYLKHPIFIFDPNDETNKLGEFANEQIFIQRWESLTEKLREMFLNVFSKENINRLGAYPIYYTPQEWIDALDEFDYNLK